jgi:hypothetical protein
MPKRVPERGFYYHYKHDPKGGVNNYAYEVVGLCRHTEKNDEDPERFMVLYRPLYPNTYLSSADYSIRPLPMFIENVTKDGKIFPRFRKITDAKVIAELGRIKKDMYP